jgi:hypothetical protein
MIAATPAAKPRPKQPSTVKSKAIIKPPETEFEKQKNHSRKNQRT